MAIIQPSPDAAKRQSAGELAPAAASVPFSRHVPQTTVTTIARQVRVRARLAYPEVPRHAVGRRSDGCFGAEGGVRTYAPVGWCSMQFSYPKLKPSDALKCLVRSSWSANGRQLCRFGISIFATVGVGIHHLLRLVHDAFEIIRRLLLLSRQSVRVDCQRNGRVAVAQPFRYNDQVDACVNGDRSVEVA